MRWINVSTVMRAMIAWLALGWMLALAGPAGAAGAAGLDNSGCLACHDGKSHEYEVTGSNGKSRALGAIAPEKFAQGVHAKMQCVDCHTGITAMPAAGASHPNAPASSTASASCSDCHRKLWEDARRDRTAAARPRLGVVVENIDAYAKSFHARASKQDKSKQNATCDGCHDTHTFDIPPKDSPAHEQWRLKSLGMCGDNCHTEALEQYGESIHGKATIGKGDPKAAVCADCHSSHAIGNTSASPVKLAITANCGSCHTDQYKSYKATYHGQINTLGYANTAKCFDCHGGHDVLAIKDPDSRVHPDNRLETCESCHNGKKGVGIAPAGFASYEPHGRTDDFDRYPQIWLAYKMMLGLLLGTFGFFWLHTVLWFYRELRDRQQGKVRPHVKLEALPAGLKGKQFQRFSATWRIAHITFALSLMILALTGMPLFYPDAPWASWLMHALGGPQIAGVIHRTCAVIFAAVFFWHLAYVVIRIARDWKNFRIFGPTSLIPGIQDGKDMLAMFKWFFGMGPRPVFDRWTYWEKFDYWAPFWGVTIIGVSGLMLWVPGVTGALLPGWVFNVAAIFHGEEALLAVVFLFTVHFFNNHFRPDKFPLDTVMFTGSMSLEHFQREHQLEYQRLKASGELDRYLVDAPSAPMALASKILGFVLIAAGLTMLFGVAVGFFTAG